VAGDWRGLHNEELHNVCSSPSPHTIREIKSRIVRYVGRVARMRDMRNAYKVSVGRPRRRWEDNIRMYVKDTVGICGLDASGSG
jgi:hypothetical protein